MVYMSKLLNCPLCGTKPVFMEFIFPKSRKKKGEYRREFSFVCCDLNPGHSITLEEAAEAWDNFVRNED